MNMNTLETQEVLGELVEVPEDNYFKESQNSEEYCKEMRRKIDDYPYEKLKDMYKEQIESLPEKTRKDVVEFLLNEKCTDGKNKHATSPVGFVKKLLHNMKGNSEKRKHSPPEIQNDDQMRKFVAILLIENQGKSNGQSLILRSGHQFQLSMERIDESEGYTLRNMLMVTKDYQASSQKLKESTVISDENKKKIRNGDTFDPKPRDSKSMELKKIYQVKWDYHSKELDDARIDFLMKHLPEGISWHSSGNYYFIQPTGHNDIYSTRSKHVSKKEKFKEIFKKYRDHDMSKDRETEYYVCVKSKSTKSGKQCHKILICPHCEKQYMTVCPNAFKNHTVACCLPDCVKGSCQMGRKKFDLFKERFNHKYGPYLFGEDSKKRKEYIDTLIGDYRDCMENNCKEKSNLYKVLVGKARACITRAKNKDFEAEEKEKLVDILFRCVDNYRLRGLYSGIKGSLDELHYAFALSVERINPDEGYVEGNVALVCKEFNTPCQMTHMKFKEVYGWNWTPEWMRINS